MQALILAGGFATRLWPLTEKRAKPLLPLGGKPLISHIVESIPFGIEISISTNQAFYQDFLDWKENFPERKVKIVVEDSDADRRKPGALAATALFVERHGKEEDLLLLAGDNYFDFQMEDFLSHFQGNPLIAVFDSGSKEKARSFGVVEVAEGRVVSFREKPDEPLSTLVSTGCYVFPAHALQDVIRYAGEHTDNLGGIFEYFLEHGRHVDAFSFHGDWIDIGSFESYMNAHRSLQKRSFISTQSLIRNSTLGNAVYISDNCLVEDSVLENVLLMPGTSIRHSRIRNCIIDEECSLSGIDLDHKMIRGGFRAHL